MLFNSVRVRVRAAVRVRVGFGVVLALGLGLVLGLRLSLGLGLWLGLVRFSVGDNVSVSVRVTCRHFFELFSKRGFVVRVRAQGL